MPAFGGEVVNGQILLDVHVRLPVRPDDLDSLDLGGAEMAPMTFQPPVSERVAEGDVRTEVLAAAE